MKTILRQYLYSMGDNIILFVFLHININLTIVKCHACVLCIYI